MKKTTILILTIILTGIFNYNSSVAQSFLSKNIANNATNNPYTSIRADNNTYIFYHKNFKPTQYNNCLIETNSPKQLYPFYAEIINKYYGIGTYFYNDLFPENKKYSEMEIDKIISEMQIDLFIKIGYDQDVYNRGSKSESSGFDMGVLFPELSGIGFSEGKSKTLRGKTVSLYVDYYDKQLMDEPILKIISLGFSKKDGEYAISKQMIKKGIWSFYNSKLILKRGKQRIDYETDSE
jgi:hypothetical protein